MTQKPLPFSFESAQIILSVLPRALCLVDLNGKILNCNAQAHKSLGQPCGDQSLHEIIDWQPRRGTLYEALRSVASSSNWSPIKLSRGNEHINFKARGLLLDGDAEPRVLMLEVRTSPERFAEHGAQVRKLSAQLSIQAETEARLRTALKESVALRRELVHRVKNNLAVVSALLRSKARSAEHPAAVAALTEASIRVRSIAIVHDILDDRHQSSTVTSKTLIEALLEHIRNSLCPSHITIVSDVLDIEIGSENALPVSLIVNELVTNAIKYAFADGIRGEVRVSLDASEEGFRLIVADSGPGISATASRVGTGSSIVEALARQLNGNLELMPRSGTSWSLTLPHSFRIQASNSLANVDRSQGELAT